MNFDTVPACPYDGAVLYDYKCPLCAIRWTRDGEQLPYILCEAPGRVGFGRVEDPCTLALGHQGEHLNPLRLEYEPVDGEDILVVNGYQTMQIPYNVGYLWGQFESWLKDNGVDVRAVARRLVYDITDGFIDVTEFNRPEPLNDGEYQVEVFWGFELWSYRVPVAIPWNM